MSGEPNGETGDAHDRPDEARVPAGRARLMAALRVREHATRGVAAGVVFALAIYLLFVARDATLATRLSYLGLTVVLALTVGAVVTTILVIAEAYKLAESEESDEE